MLLQEAYSYYNMNDGLIHYHHHNGNIFNAFKSYNDTQVRTTNQRNKHDDYVIDNHKYGKMKMIKQMETKTIFICDLIEYKKKNSNNRNEYRYMEKKIQMRSKKKI